MRVLIVGGGSAGWITAATLLSRLSPDQRKSLTLTLVESPDTGRIGVGEATIPTFRNMLAEFGIRESAFFKACNATVKHAIRFEGWTGPDSLFSHPFHRFLDPLSDQAAARWMASDRTRPFSEVVSVQDALIRQGRAPRAPRTPDYSGPVPYAYHLDAERFTDFLVAHCKAGGVRHELAHVGDVSRDATTGRVLAVNTQDGRRFEADLFVDCTGFQALLLADEDRGRNWVNQSHHLLCDRAVAMQVPYGPGEAANSFTQATAMPAGWAWNIGLSTRRGRGYVYSSAHTDPDSAEAGLRADDTADTGDIKARHLTFQVGRRKSAWVNNVVCIGLSAGFLEPLESTGLYFAQTAARLLALAFPPNPAAGSAPELSSLFNTRMAALHDSILDFILLHYALSKRSEPFWTDAAQPTRLTESLRDNLALWRLRPPTQIDLAPGLSPFTHRNFEFILLGMEWSLDGAAPGAGRLGAHPGIQALLSALPGLDQFQRQLTR